VSNYCTGLKMSSDSTDVLTSTDAAEFRRALAGAPTAVSSRVVLSLSDGLDNDETNRAVDRAAWLAIREICCQRRADAQRFTIRPHEGAKKNIEQAERMLKGLQVRQQKQGR
jgi:agmatine/peptidylarginine deiminase